MKEKKTLDNILVTVESSPAAEAKETDQEQCGFNTKKKIRIKENNFLVKPSSSFSLKFKYQ